MNTDCTTAEPASSLLSLHLPDVLTAGATLHGCCALCVIEKHCLSKSREQTLKKQATTSSRMRACVAATLSKR